MKLPAQIYAIYPLNKEGDIAGVYVGMTSDVPLRLYQHTIVTPSGDKQEELHSMMRENGFYYQVLDDVKVFDDSHLEADWISFFESQNLKLFNRAKVKGYKVSKGIKSPGGNVQNLIKTNKYPSKLIVPHWGGFGVVWKLMPKPQE